MLDERRGRQIPEDLCARLDALSVKAAMRNPVRHLQKSLSLQDETAAAGERPAAAYVCVVGRPIRTKNWRRQNGLAAVRHRMSSEKPM